MLVIDEEARLARGQRGIEAGGGRRVHLPVRRVRRAAVPRTEITGGEKLDGVGRVGVGGKGRRVEGNLVHAAKHNPRTGAGLAGGCQ